MKYLSIILLAFISLVINPHSSYAGEFKVVTKVINGDTIVVNGGQTIRLIGANAPQAEEYYAQQAYEYTTNQLLGQEVEVEVDNINVNSGHKDIYGRKLAYIYRVSDRFFINLALVRNGYAYVSNKTISDRRRIEFQTQQLDARKSQSGLWKMVSKTPEELAKDEGRVYEEPAFENKPEYSDPDIRVQIIWAKKADPRFRIAGSAEEAKFLQQLYQDDLVSVGKVSPLVRVRKSFAEAATKFYQEKGVPLVIEVYGDDNQELRFSAKGMDQETADKFCQINAKLFIAMEFVEVVFSDTEAFLFTYKVKR